MIPPIAEYSTGIDRGNAYWMARISKEVYLTKSDTDQRPDEAKILENLTRDDSNFIQVVGADKNSAQGALIEHKKFYCMAFRGTNELADWIDNINAFAVDNLFGKFHRGFWNSVEDIWEPLYSKYVELNKQNKRPLFITGHSLGGAMATIAASRLIHLDLPFTSVYTFGQPRALSRESARIFNAECKSRFYRFHNNNDLVTRVPTRLMGYSHVGTYLYISSEKTIYREPGFWFRFLDIVDGALDAVREKGIDGVEDHSMDRYLEASIKWDFVGS